MKDTPSGAGGNGPDPPLCRVVQTPGAVYSSSMPTLPNDPTRAPVGGRPGPGAR